MLRCASKNSQKNVISNHLKNLLYKEIIGYNVLKMFLGTPYSLNSFQNLENIFIVYQKYCCISSSKTFNINLNNHLNHNGK